MKIKVQCPCGSKFEFEAEPVNGRMPVSLACPTCGADATALCNEVIQSQLAAVQAPAPAGGGLKIHSERPSAPSPVPVSQAEEASAAETPCPRHKSDPAVETCRVCGKPICLKCMEQFGYVCSVFCRQKADATGVEVPVYGQQKSVRAARSVATARYLTITVALCVVLAVGFYVWYTWFAREYKIAYLRKLPVPDRHLLEEHPARTNFYFQLIGPGQLLTIENQQASVMDCASKKTLWSATLPDKSAAQSYSFFFNEEDYLGGSRAVVTSNDLWISSSGALSRFDRLTGTPKEVPVKEPILNVIPGESSILVVSGNSGHELLTRIALPDGTTQSEELNPPASDKTEPAKTPPARTAPAVPAKPAAAATKGGRPGKGKNNQTAPAQAAKVVAMTAKTGDADLDESQAMFDKIHAPFISAGPNVVQFKTKMLEQKIVSHEAMKPKPKGPSVLENANLNASQGMAVAKEILGDLTRDATGGVEMEDASRYEVTLHRRFAPDVADWKGEVTGPPQFFPLKTVDVLAAGKAIYVFSKQNKKLWEAKLTFSAPPRYGGKHPPVLETADALYFADAGILTRFDLATGEVKWRYNSVGVSSIQTDTRGALYLITTDASPDSIQYSQEIKLDPRDKTHKLLVKLDPATGKVMWKHESAADQIMLCGKFLYATRVTQVSVLLRLEEGPDTHYYAELLDPGDGKPIWTFHRTNRRVADTEADGKWMMIHMEDEVYVLNFFSL